MTRMVVTVMPKRGSSTPRARRCAGRWSSSGSPGVDDVRIGKRIELEIAGDDPAGQARAMCEQLLANALIEDYHVVEAAS